MIDYNTAWSLLLYSPFMMLGAVMVILFIGGLLSSRDIDRIKKQGVGVD